MSYQILNFLNTLDQVFQPRVLEPQGVCKKFQRVCKKFQGMKIIA